MLAAQFDAYQNRKDKSVSLRFITQEQTPAQIGHLHSMLDGFGYLYFKAESEITAAERDEIDGLQTDLYDSPKTQSQRLRNTLFVLWKQNPEGFREFADFYKWHTDRIIQHFKDKITPQGM